MDISITYPDTFPLFGVDFDIFDALTKAMLKSDAFNLNRLFQIMHVLGLNVSMQREADKRFNEYSGVKFVGLQNEVFTQLLKDIGIFYGGIEITLEGRAINEVEDYSIDDPGLVVQNIEESLAARFVYALFLSSIVSVLLFI